MHALDGEDMPADQLGERAQDGCAGTDMIGQGRDIEIDTLAGISLALPVQRLVFAVFGIQDHRQQARPDMAARDHMERRWRLSNLLARAAGELTWAPSRQAMSFHFFELQSIILASRFEPCSRPGGFPTSSNSHTVAVFRNGCTKIPIRRAKAQEDETLLLVGD